MVKVLTGDEVEEILQECCANGDVANYMEGGPEQFFELPALLGRGYWHNIQLRPGLQLSLSDVEKRQIHHYHIRQHPQPMPLTFSYYLLGGCRVENDGLKVTHEETAGQSYIYCVPTTAELERYPAEQRIRHVKLTLSPELLPAFSDRLHELPADLRMAVERPEKALLYVANRITPAQQSLLQQLFQAPYQGITRHFYLEAKVLELLALHFDQMLTAPSTRQLPANEVDRIYHAQTILNQNMSHPPSVSELARQVQLNERKLKEGFRQVFDTTVFGYLTQRRMQAACKLLAQQRSVSAVAAAVGYASSTAFSNAFRRQFGVSPKGYQLGQRHTFF